MARPRKVSDERLVAAAGTAIGRLGPGFTLADVAAEAQVSAGTLVHRFGSKHGLLLAMLRAATADARAAPAGAPVADPVAAVRDALVERYRPLDDPGSAANNLAQLAADLSDERLRAGMAEFYDAVRAGTRALLRRAVDAGALPGAPPVPVAARILTAVADGAAIHWSTDPRGSLRHRLAADLDAILAGWRRRPTDD
ncbi:TetR/AcrR family transcriptional regulator [Rugosimonospora africana]|uniref:TetR family transcriptional regulator n=1 Tax=Rugosimonospora africana TaxID=556532 RepID=A0A8J3VQN6_9ACTN|nr:TetR/AcrR family transcriptional regulator [Rugosimonospora africana]GIH15325.1 TetR family transcriptional regulator [Rugosimonospora africana]